MRSENGTLIDIDGRPALRFERRYAHPMERVWRAISDPKEMRSWFPSNVEGERAVGAELIFVDDAQRAAAVDAGEPTRVEGPAFRGRVVTYDPPKVFSFTWGSELLRFELHADGGETVLVFTQVLSHPSVAARNGSGWHMCLSQLDGLLGAGAPAPASDGWEDVYDDYLERIGPALGTPARGGSMSWERATHVDATRVREAATDPAELQGWGGAAHADEPVTWEVEPGATGTVYRVTHADIGDDAELAATWHALLIQLDMYLAAGELVPVEANRWVDAYKEVLR
jgi:uncharacterized protein YndB with AHSA1/START domain